jgi:uncharacterized membrane protein
MKKMISTKYSGVNARYLVFLLGLAFSLIFSVVVLYTHSTSADDHGKSVDTILQEIRAKQGLGPEGTIDPRKVSNRELEELGDAVMSLEFPDPEQHEYMDNMMGGEGSRSLELMHRRMGYNYLAGGGYGMMGPGMMGFGFHGGMMGNGFWGGMMGNRYGYHSYWGFVMGIIILAAIGVVVYLIIRNQRTGGRTGDRLFGERETPLEIARKRYARGEITKEEFEEIKKNL